jgi:hypothetical protein
VNAASVTQKALGAKVQFRQAETAKARFSSGARMPSFAQLALLLPSHPFQGLKRARRVWKLDLPIQM